MGVSEELNSVETDTSGFHGYNDRAFQKNLIVWKPDMTTMKEKKKTEFQKNLIVWKP